MDFSILNFDRILWYFKFFFCDVRSCALDSYIDSSCSYSHFPLIFGLSVLAQVSQSEHGHSEQIQFRPPLIRVSEINKKAKEKRKESVMELFCPNSRQKPPNNSNLSSFTSIH